MSYSATGWSPRIRLFSDRRFNLREEHKYPYFIYLPRHPEHPLNATNGDPRKVWLYDCGITGLWAAEDITQYGERDENGILGGRWTGRAYYFQNEADLLVFSLRWNDFQNDAA